MIHLLQRTVVAAFMWCTLVWVLTMVLLVDGVEGNRMRFSTEPYLYLLTLWIAGNAIQRAMERAGPMFSRPLNR